MTPASIDQSVAAIAAIDAVPQILEVICRTTGMGFAAVARVTESRWVCCGVRDEIAFGLVPGGELKIETTICNEIRQSGRAVVIDHVAEDPQYCAHPTPAMYGFQSYISVPIQRADGSFWGTLCAIDPRPARLNSPEVRQQFALFAQLISFHLDAGERLAASESALLDARQTALLREQFVAALGHDLRAPLQAVSTGLAVLQRAPERAGSMVPMLGRSVRRMGELVQDLMDLARGRLGSGMTVTAIQCGDLAEQFQQIVDEVQTAWPGRAVRFDCDMASPIWCEPARIAQLFSNLLSNAFKHGAPDQPVHVSARSNRQEFELAVANGGTTIPQHERDQLFQPYFRASAGHTGEGLGLGLYIVSEIARAHGGSVRVASSDSLTTFTFRMPSSLDVARR